MRVHPGFTLIFLTLAGLGPAIRELRSRNALCVGIALPRIRKPGEARIDEHVKGLQPDVILLRLLGSLADATSTLDCGRTKSVESRPLRIADFHSTSLTLYPRSKF